jgi:hypothetical protein
VVKDYQIYFRRALGVVATLLLIATIACAQDEEPINYGPPESEPRGTLFQWSYGTTFSGGPNLEEPLISDRPDFTEASVTVGRNVLQLETGYTYVFNDDAGVQTKAHSFPEALFRYGIFAEWFELRLGQNFVHEDDGITSNTGATDTYLGVKFALTPQEGWLPEMALVPQATVPTGHPAFRNNAYLPGMNWLYGWDINDWLATGGSTQFNNRLDGVTENIYTEWAQSWTINYTLTERLGAYTEYFGLYPNGAQTEQTQHYFDGGFTYKITPDLQWDIRGGVGLNDAADDYFVGMGLVMRFY